MQKIRKKVRARHKLRKVGSRLSGKRTNSTAFILIIVTLVLAAFGLLMIFEASAVSALRTFDDKFHFLRNQGTWAIIGLVSMFLASRIDYRLYYSMSVFLLGGVILSLIMVFLPGIGLKVSGAHRWINLGFFNFQPTELAKLVLVIYLAAWFTHKEKSRLLSFGLLLLVVLGLIVLEPDLGTAIIIGAIAMVLYFLSGAPLIQFVLLIPVGVASVLLLALTSPYRYQRMMTFLKPGSDPLGASYHVQQLLLGFGSGGWFGVGLGRSLQKFSYLPEATTDSIFSIVGEETGFIGASLVLLLYLVLIVVAFKVAVNSPTRFGQLLAAGIASWIAIQTIINLGAAIALLPLTGVPLMLLSYGGSSLLVTFLGIGILLNISKQSK